MNPNQKRQCNNPKCPKFNEYFEWRPNPSTGIKELCFSGGFMAPLNASQLTQADTNYCCWQCKELHQNENTN